LLKRTYPDFDEKGKRLRTSGNQSICLAAWTHAYVNTLCQRGLCCLSLEQHKMQEEYVREHQNSEAPKIPTQSLEEYWNSPYLREIRKKMLTNEKVPECRACDEQRLSPHTYRDRFDELFGVRMASFYDSTDDEGRTSLQPVSFDYRTSICNFKCRMCSSLYSTAWEIEGMSGGNPSIFDRIRTPENKGVIRDFQDRQMEEEFFKAVSEGRVEEIYWAGGEPLLQEIHWRTMKELVDRGFSKKVLVRYNTNLSVIDWHGVNLFRDLLPHFKDYLVCCSVDGAGEVGEWIRTGLKWEKWLANIREAAVFNRGRNRVRIDITLTLPGLFGIKGLFDLSKELDLEIQAKNLEHGNPGVTMLSVQALPRKIMEPFIDDLLAYMQPLAGTKQESLIFALSKLKELPTQEETNPEQYKHDIVQGRWILGQLGRKRRDGKEGKALRLEEIYSARPEVLAWWYGYHFAWED
jgi:hypothetical protein